MHGRDDEHDPLDLPLGGEAQDRSRDTRWDAGPGDGEAESAPVAGSGAPPPRRRWPLVLLAALAFVVLLALAAVGGYLLPRPGPPVLRLDTSLVDFGSVRMGEIARAHELTLESTGGRPVLIGDLTLGGPAADAFEIAADGCSGTSLAPQRSCTVVLRFAPRRAAALRATLEVPAEASNGPLSVPLAGDGVAPEPVLDRRRIEFPPVPVGASSRLEVLVLGNRGSAPLALDGMATAGPAAGEFQLDGDRCTGESLETGEECTVRVVFTPATEGERRAVLRFRLRGTEAGGPPPEVALSGVGIAPFPGGGAGAPGAAASPSSPGRGTPAPQPLPPPPPPPELRVEPAALDFGEAPVGGEGEGHELTLRNAGGSPARVTPLAISGPDAASFTLRDDRCGDRSLGPGERCTVGVVLRPRQEGVLQARLTFGSPDLPEGAEPPRVAMRGAGAVARLVLSARALDFGEVRSGASADRRLTLSNAGRAALEVRGLGVRGEGARDFAVTADGCPETVPLAPGERCEITVRFAPTAEGAEGLREAVLAVRHGGADIGVEVALRGIGLPAPAPRAEVAPGALRFGAVRVGARSEIETVRVANRGSARLVLGEARIEGRDGGAFQLVPGSCSGASFLVPGSDCTIGIRFSPGAAGERRARLVIPHDAEGGHEVVELSGTGG